jgi:hypothetical protein
MSVWIDAHPVAFALLALPSTHLALYAVLVALDAVRVRFGASPLPSGARKRAARA